MKEIKWIFVLFAAAAAFDIIAIGVAIGERSILGILGCIVILMIIMGFGFKTKKKWREAGKL